jgi:HSP20 family protein
MVVRRWDPFKNMVSLRTTMNRLFEDSFIPWSRPWTVFRVDEKTLNLDLYHTPDSLVIKAGVPGLKPEDVDITVVGNSLTIRCESRGDEEVKKESYVTRVRR